MQNIIIKKQKPVFDRFLLFQERRPRTFEARMRLDSTKKDIHSDILLVLYESARRDSNPRPRPWQGRAPPTEPLAHNFARLTDGQVILYYILNVLSIYNFNFFTGFSTFFYSSIHLIITSISIPQAVFRCCHEA